MSVLEPDDDRDDVEPGDLPTGAEEDPNDAEILAGLEADLADIALPEADDVSFNVTELSDRRLLERIDEIRDELYAMQEMLKPSTQHGRDLHSERAALLIEQSNRGLAGR